MKVQHPTDNSFGKVTVDLKDEADWNMFRRYPRYQIDTGGAWRGGGIEFARHMGKKLSQELWDDLIFRMNVTYLSIYEPCDETKSGGIVCMSGYCGVYLDEEGWITDIHYNPCGRRPSEKIEEA